MELELLDKTPTRATQPNSLVDNVEDIKEGNMETTDPIE